jgi:hypothetical protein
LEEFIIKVIVEANGGGVRSRILSALKKTEGVITAAIVRINPIVYTVGNIIFVKDESEVDPVMLIAEKNLLTLGVYPSERGFSYLREVVTLAVRAPDMLQSPKQKLYPLAAKTHGVSSRKLQKYMRGIIMKIWKQGNYEAFLTMFIENGINPLKPVRTLRPFNPARPNARGIRYEMPEITDFISGIMYRTQTELDQMGYSYRDNQKGGAS